MGDHPTLRTACRVPFCHRSCKGTWNWWLCPEHYRGVSLAARARHRKLKVYCKRMGWIESDKRSWWTTTYRARRIMDAAARTVIRSAIKRATGL
jgi:hypothetical protein